MAFTRRKFIGTVSVSPSLARVGLGQETQLVRMAFRLQARMGLFPVTKKEWAYQPNRPIDPRTLLGESFPQSPKFMATVQWNADPALGFPELPYKVNMATNAVTLERFGFTIASTYLQASNGFTFNLIDRAKGPSGILCLTARVSADDTRTEIFAIDAFGEEIPETRQSGNAPNGAAFLGPDIYGLRASGPVTLAEISGFAIHDDSVEMKTMANVAPPFASVQGYAAQSYCGHSHNALQAAEIRVFADAFARANTTPPPEPRLDTEMHRLNSVEYKNWLLAQEFMVKSENNIGSLIGNGDFSYSVPVAGSPGSSTALYPSRLWQYLALMGPVESATLGQSVSLPIEEMLPILVTGADVFAAVKQFGKLPFPLISIAASHLLKPSTHVSSVQYARLTLPPGIPSLSASQTEPRMPESLDKPATADILLRFQRSMRLNAHFLAREVGGTITFEDEVAGWGSVHRRPKAYFPNSNSFDYSAVGDPEVRIGPVNLPLEAEADQAIRGYPRDVFGRWGQVGMTTCRVRPWPVSAPKMLAAEVSYRADGLLELATKIAWDWSVRTPFEIRVGMAIEAMNSSNTDLKPKDNINLPSVGATPLSIRFRADGSPYLFPTAPSGFMVDTLKVPTGDATDLNVHVVENSQALRCYVLRTPLGSFDAIFSTRPEQLVVIVADAWEKVSGQTESRRSTCKGLMRQVQDPRPPILAGETWKLHWASRPNGANIASVRLWAPTGVKNGHVAGFHAWRAEEASILDLVITEQFGNTEKGEAALQAIREQRDMNLRLIQIQGLVEQHLWKPHFRRKFVNLFEAADTSVHESDYELIVPGTLTGLAFLMFSAVSKTGVESDKAAVPGEGSARDSLKLSNLCAVAVPIVRTQEAPTLRILTSDIGNTFAASGVCLAIVGVDSDITPDDVRIFWDCANGITDSSALMHRLRPVAIPSHAAAKELVPEISEVCDRIARDRVHLYMLKPAPSWNAHFFAADVLKSNAAVPAEQIASPRSQLISAQILPVPGPELTLNSQESSSGRKRWSVLTRGLVSQSLAGYSSCEIQLELFDKSQVLKRFGPTPFVKFSKDGFVSDIPKLTATYHQDSGLVDIEYLGAADTVSVRLTASDPAARGCSVELL